MKKFDVVKLKTEVSELAEKGIHKGCAGIVIDVENMQCKVLFLAERIFGDCAVATVSLDALIIVSRFDDSLNDEMNDFLSKLDESKHVRFLDDDVHEYDVIELTVEKEKYAKYGVHKGMTGTVMEDNSINNEWYVIFESSDKSGEDIQDLNVAREDFKIIFKSPVKRKN